MPSEPALPIRHGLGPPSDWICRWAPLLPQSARVLDVACGAGRHLRWLAAQGHPVTGVDQDPAALAVCQDIPQARLIQADLEQGPWPLPGERFDAVVVTHYLWRPLWPALLEALAPGGLLLIETFSAGHEAIGRPRRPAFVLQPGELLQVGAGLRILGYEEGRLEHPSRCVQRMAAAAPEAGELASHAAPRPLPAALPQGMAPAGLVRP